MKIEVNERARRKHGRVMQAMAEHRDVIASLELPSLGSEWDERSPPVRIGSIPPRWWRDDRESKRYWKQRNLRDQNGFEFSRNSHIPYPVC